MANDNMTQQEQRMVRSPMSDRSRDREPVRRARTPVETGWLIMREKDEHATCRQVRRLSWSGRLWLVAKVARDTWTLAGNFWYDFVRVWKYSSAIWTGNSQAKLAALVTMAAHGIEKGLSLPAPRPGFGRELIELLLCRLERYLVLFGPDRVTRAAVDALRAYRDFHAGRGISDPALETRLARLECVCDSAEKDRGLKLGGVAVIRREQFLEDARIDLTRFFASRHSVREFSDHPVNIGDIEAAVRLAMYTPSCCNRQAARVWLVQERDRIQGVLTIQEGARGFKEQVPMVLVVTADLACFQSAGERYQAWIDGGLFAMSLVWALHSRGLVSCMLNWSKRKEKDRELRAYLGIPQSENIVVLIAVGHPPPTWRVAVSARRPLCEVLRVEEGRDGA
jgi:nitroreductase